MELAVCCSCNATLPATLGEMAEQAPEQTLAICSRCKFSFFFFSPNYGLFFPEYLTYHIYLSISKHTTFIYDNGLYVSLCT